MKNMSKAPNLLSRAILIMRLARSSNILGFRTWFAWAKLLTEISLPIPRWYSFDSWACKELTSTLRLSHPANWPKISASNWFQHLKVFTLLLPSYFLINHLNSSLGRNLQIWVKTYSPFILLFLNVSYKRKRETAKNNVGSRIFDIVFSEIQKVTEEFSKNI